MKIIEIARKLSDAGQVEHAQKAYIMALSQGINDPQLEFEAATYLLFSGGDYKIAYTYFVSLYNRGYYKAELMDIMLKAFYEPNVKKQKKQYKVNCKRLNDYQYLFRKDFIEFEQMPILFFPFDNDGFIPYYKEKDRFGDYVNFNNEVIDRYFFSDLENPILAKDVYSQYQLEYLYDNIRKSEWVAKDNHIYLHYTDWTQFCTYLCCINFGNLLLDRKFVFLIEDEIGQYPIDFKERFDIDYSTYNIKPVGIREVKKIIWHTQLSSHNGGDFFNEILYDHPNLLIIESLMYDSFYEGIKEVYESIKDRTKSIKRMAINCGQNLLTNEKVFDELLKLKNPTLQDCFVASFFGDKSFGDNRIVPAILFQPHFKSIRYDINLSQNNYAILFSEQYEEIKKSPFFKGFKYIKTFTPIRRPTTSYAATVKFTLNAYEKAREQGKADDTVLSDAITNRILNRSFMIDSYDRLYKDSVLVRFEDGKLNPKATFTALAEFLDIPYTQSMTYCSSYRGVNKPSLEGNVIGFDTATVYRTYDEYANNAERCFVEYMSYDVYKAYGYDFKYYDSSEMTKKKMEELIKNFTTINGFIEYSIRYLAKKVVEETEDNYNDDDIERVVQEIIDEKMEKIYENRLEIAETLMKGIKLVNKELQPLHFMKKLELNTELLEQPLYH